MPDGPADASRAVPSSLGSSADAAHAVGVASIATATHAAPATASRPRPRAARSTPAAPSTTAPAVTHGRNAGYRDDSHAAQASVTAAVAGTAHGRRRPSRCACHRRAIPNPPNAASGGASAATYAVWMIVPAL